MKKTTSWFIHRRRFRQLKRIFMLVMIVMRLMYLGLKIWTKISGL